MMVNVSDCEQANRLFSKALITVCAFGQSYTYSQPHMWQKFRNKEAIAGIHHGIPFVKDAKLPHQENLAAIL
jgi:hypothetical protein